MDVPSLPQRQRLLLAELSGVARRYGVGDRLDVPRTQRSPWFAQSPPTRCCWVSKPGLPWQTHTGASGPTAELLQAAGADMTIAREHAAELRARYESSGISYPEA